MRKKWVAFVMNRSVIPLTFKTTQLSAEKPRRPGRAMVLTAARFIMAGIVFFSIGITCSADVIWEPENDFFSEHRSESEYMNRDFYVNAEQGSAFVYEAPGSSSSFARITNGTVLNVAFTHSKRRVEWGLVEFMINENGEAINASADGSLVGWIDMTDLLLVYDCISFNQEHGSEFYSYTGDYDTLIAAGENTVVWTYPGSGVTASGLLEVNDLWFQIAYDDEDGRQWGYIGYHYGLRDVWICISDPENAAIPAFGVEEPELIPPNPEKSERITESTDDTGSLSRMIYILVGAVVLITIILIPVLMKKKRSGHV